MAQKTTTMPLQPNPAKNPLQDEKVFRLLVDTVSDYAIFVLDPAGYIATWNPGAERLKGYKRDEVIGKHFSIFYPESDVQARKPELELEVTSQTGRLQEEGWRIRKDGSRFWANVVTTRLVDETGKLIGFGKITRDLTERRLSEQRFRMLVEGVIDYAIFSLDQGGHVTSWNSGAERLKGYTADEIMGRHFSNFYTPEDRAEDLPKKVLESALRDGHWEGEGWRVRKDGSRFWASVVVTPMRGEEGELTGFTKITRDLTERKRLLDQVHAHAAELELRVTEREQTNAELEAFSYSVSHDLRAPLRAIEGFASALKEDYGDRLDATACEYIDHICAAALRMNRLVEDLLNYSRLSRIDLALSPTNVCDAIDQAVRELDDRRGTLTVHVSNNLQVCAHKPTLVQIIFNLLTNAEKFVDPGKEPQIELSTSHKDGYLRLSVKDNGIGIAPDHQQRIFQVFERLHTIEEYPGTGIGLAIVKRGVERMHGRYGVESAPGAGSTFWIELPEIR
jgi:PAS domain S-box-containing protein